MQETKALISAMTGEAQGGSRAAAPGCGFSRGTTARSVSLSWGAREVGSPCEWRERAPHCSRAMVGDSTNLVGSELDPRPAGKRRLNRQQQAPQRSGVRRRLDLAKTHAVGQAKTATG